jgi:hypothetical protein
VQYALVHGTRSEAFQGGKGACPSCGSAMTAKCGPHVMHHWAHFGRRHCDPWWENETQWHRDWKALFPADCREVSHTAPDGEVHRADIRTPSGIYIEVQHSAMADAERISREMFYKNLVWVLDGSTFRKNFEFHHLLPDPSAEIAHDLKWYQAELNMHGSNHGLFVRRSDPDGCIHGIHEIQDQIDKAYRGHHQYVWKRPHKTWLSAKCPVYIDFGEDQLARLQTYDDTGLLCVFRLSKSRFVRNVMAESDARQIAISTAVER